MTILPWNNFVIQGYIRLEYLKIDGNTKKLKKEWSVDGLSESSNTSNFYTIHPRTEYDIDDYSKIELKVYFGIEDLINNGYDSNVVKYYKNHYKDFKVYCVVSGLDTKLRIPFRMSLENQSSPLDESPFLWSKEIQISENFFGKDILINIYVEDNLEKLFKLNQNAVFSGGEIGQRTENIRINFKDKEPPAGSGAEIQIRKVYFEEGRDFETNEIYKDIPKQAIYEELWVSTESEGPNDKPSGYVNMDLEHLQIFLEEGNIAMNRGLLDTLKQFKQKQIASSIWKTFCSATVSKIASEFEKALNEENEEKEKMNKDDAAMYAIESLTEFEQSALGFFCQKITEKNGVQNDRISSIKEILKKYFDDGEGIDGFNSLLHVEIDKKIGIKKYSKVMYDKYQDLSNNDDDSLAFDGPSF